LIVHNKKATDLIGISNNNSNTCVSLQFHAIFIEAT